MDGDTELERCIDMNIFSHTATIEGVEYKLTVWANPDGATAITEGFVSTSKEARLVNRDVSADWTEYEFLRRL